jgi:hypothetical protein
MSVIGGIELDFLLGHPERAVNLAEMLREQLESYPNVIWTTVKI